MRSAALWAGGLGCGTLVWIAAPELQSPARLLTAALLGPAPVAFLLQARVAETLPHPFSRLQIYAGSITALAIIGAGAFAAGRSSGFGLRDFGFLPLTPGEFLLWTSGITVIAGLIVAGFKAAGTRESEIMRAIIPVTVSEKLVFCVLSVCAGVFEEIAFRGFLLTAVTVASGSVVAGVLLSSLAFGLLHAHQHAAGAARATLLGLILCIPLVLTGSIYASMAAHALIDIVGGLWLARWLVR